MPSSNEIRRRVKAAREIAGLSVEGLAKKIDQKGLGERTLRSLESPNNRPFKSMELKAIAEACNLPYQFFTVNFWEVLETNETRITKLEERMEQLEKIMLKNKH